MEDKSNTAQIYSVTRIVKAVRDSLNQSFPSIWVKGELSGFVQAASGHIYFDLKDESAQIKCAMFRSYNRQLEFNPEDGMEVIVRGKVDVYQQRGSMQLIVEEMEEAGLGDLRKRFEKLKKALHKEGLFDEDRKKAIPERPRAIGVITSAQGAALRDVLSTLDKRFGPSEVIIYPATVQGKSAPQEICEMLSIANQRKETDVLLLVRGGGSIEDLQAFNEEVVARAIASSHIPIVSGIGHEIDFTIADFVSDYRVPTPTAAAVKISLDPDVVLDSLDSKKQQLENSLYDMLDDLSEALENFENRFADLHPSARINNYAQQTDDLQSRINASVRNMLHSRLQYFNIARTELIASQPSGRVEKLRYLLETLSKNMPRTMALRMHNSKEALSGYSQRIEALSPYSTLKRGYAIVTNLDGHIIRSANKLAQGENVDVKLNSGDFKATVKKVNR